MTSNASASSQTKKSSSLFDYFKPKISTSSPSGRSSATPGPSTQSTDPSQARSQSVQVEGAVSGSTGLKSGKGKGSRPGPVARPGAGSAALKRMATAPAALQVSTSLPSSRPSQDRSHSLDSPSQPSHPSRKVIRDAEDTPRKEAEGQAASSPTPKGNDASSMSPSRMQTHRTSPLLARNSAQPSSSSLTSLTVDESDSDSRRQTIPLARNSKSSPRNLHQAPSADHNDSDSDEDLPFHSASSNSSRRPTSSKKGKRIIRDSPDSDFEGTLTPRKPSTSPPTTRVLRSASKPPTSALPSPSSSTRSATRRQASTALSESAGTVPQLSLVAATSSAALHSNEESTSTSSDTLRLRPLSPRSSNSNNPTTPRKRGTLRSSTHPTPSDTISNRSPGGGSRFERAPSGSPLSDLAPSPVKKPRAQSVRSETWRPHSFELIVEVPAARWRTMRAGSIRRERDSLTSDFTERHYDEDEAMKEESEDGKSGDQATDEENQKSSRRNPSRSAKRKSPTGARRSLRRRSSSLPPDRKGGKGKSRASPSSSSSSSEEEDEPEEEEEEEEDVMAALARARDRVAAGQAMLVTSPEVSTSSTAPTTASSMHATQAQDEDHVRRSSRTKHATDHFSPTASSSRAQGDAKDRAKTNAKDESSRGFERSMKEMQAQKQKGRGAGYYQAMKKEIDNEDDDLDKDSQNSDDEDLPNMNLADSTRIDTLAQGIAGAVSEDDLLSPDKLAHKKRATEVANILGDEEKKKKSGAGMVGETVEERKARTIWKSSHRYEPLDLKSMKGEGWLGDVASVIKAGFANPQSFPTSLTLFSHLREDGTGSAEDHQVATKWLLSLVCHPTIPVTLVEPLQNLLHRLAQQSLKSRTNSESPLLETEDLVEILVRLGAERDKLCGTVEAPSSEEVADREEDDSMDLDPLDFRPATPPRLGKVLSVEQRTSCVERWCRIVQVLSSTRSFGLNSSSVEQLVEICVRLSLEASSAILRGPLERCLLALLAAPTININVTHFAIFRRLARIYHSTRPRTQVEVLRALPHRSTAMKQLRKWLAWSFLVDDSTFDGFLRDQTSLGSNLLPYLLGLVQGPPPSSALNPPPNSTDSSNDIRLFQQATILTIAFTSLDHQLNAAEDKDQSQDLLDQIKLAIKKIDAKLRADARKGLLVARMRAKNLLTSLSNSLDYQLRRARGQEAGFDITHVDDGKGEDENERKKKKAKLSEEEEEEETKEETEQSNAVEVATIAA